jgi:uncharacterized membrane protein
MHRQVARARVLSDQLDYIALGLVMLILFVPPSVRASPLTAGAAVFCLLWAPGYALTSALFPDSDELPWFYRLGLPLLLSLVVILFLGIGYQSVGVRIEAAALALGITWTFVCASVVSIVRRHRLRSRRPNAAGGMSSLSTSRVVACATAAVGAAAIIGLVAPSFTERPPAEGFIELSAQPARLTEADGQAIYHIDISVTSHEPTAREFEIVVYVDNDIAKVIELPSLSNPQSWHAETSVTLTRALSRVSIQLRGASVEREVHLWARPGR